MTDTVTLAHISDLHLGPLPHFSVRHWNVKRGLGYMNWQRGRRHAHLPEVLEHLVADMLAARPDHIAVTGDLVNIGLPREYETALAWLESLGSPDRVSVVPGNHDIYTRLSLEQGVGRWAAYMSCDSWGRQWVREGEGRGGFPFLRRVGPLALIGLNSAVPTPPLVASGRLGSGQTAVAARLLEQLRGEPVARVVLIHHPPLPGPAARLRGLEDAPRFERVLRANGAELVLHGHNHRDMLTWRAWNGGSIPVVGIASGSMGRADGHEHLARYNLFRISRSAGSLRIEHIARGLERPDGPVVELERQVLSLGSHEAAHDDAKTSRRARWRQQLRRRK